MSTDILACPCSKKSAMIEGDEGLTCGDPGCAHSQAENAFKLFQSAPVLIAFDRTDTVCTPQAYESGAFYFPRTATMTMELAREIVYGTSPVTVDNCKRFVEMVKALASAPAVLIIGSGSHGAGTEKLWSDTDIARTGTDIYYSDSVDYIADAHYLPFKDQSFDGVWIQAVLEHVADPPAVVAEIERVLKPGGVVYAETPFMQQVHEGGYDFSRYTVTGHRYLFRNFDLERMGGNKGPGFVLAWAVKYFVWGLTRSKKAGIAAAIPFFLLARVADRFVSEKALWDGGSGVYFLGAKAAGPAISAAELPKLYRGFQG